MTDEELYEQLDPRIVKELREYYNDGEFYIKRGSTKVILNKYETKKLTDCLIDITKNYNDLTLSLKYDDTLSKCEIFPLSEDVYLEDNDIDERMGRIQQSHDNLLYQDISHHKIIYNFSKFLAYLLTYSVIYKLNSDLNWENTLYIHHKNIQASRQFLLNEEVYQNYSSTNDIIKDIDKLFEIDKIDSTDDSYINIQMNDATYGKSKTLNYFLKDERNDSTTPKIKYLELKISSDYQMYHYSPFQVLDATAKDKYDAYLYDQLINMTFEYINKFFS